MLSEIKLKKNLSKYFYTKMAQTHNKITKLYLKQKAWKKQSKHELY